MQSKIPLYPYGAKEARERGEIEKWRESFRENCACAGGIDILIRENFDGMHLKDGTVEKIVELYGYKRVEHVLANTVQERRGDGRFSSARRKILCKRFSTKSRMALESRADSGLNPLVTESHGGQNGMRAGTA